MGSTDALSSIAVDRAHEPGSLARQRLAARALSEALLVRAAREVIAARPEAALLLAERAGEGPEARSLAIEARRRLGSPAP